MASIERRDTKSGPRWRVKWREHGHWQQLTWDDHRAAVAFHALVEAHDNTWPPGYGPRRVGDTPTLREWCDYSLDTHTRANPRTLADYRRDLTRHVYPTLGHLPITDLDAHHNKTLIDQMRRAGLAAKTIANVHGMVSSFLTDAVNTGRLDRNPLKGGLADLPTVRTEEMCFLTPPEFDSIARHIPNPYRPLAVLLVGTGLRWSEATALQVQDVDLFAKRRAIHVRRAWKRTDGNYFELGEPKTARSRRTVALSTELVDLLIPLVAGKRGSEFVFTTPQGRPVRHSNFYNRCWRPAVTRARAEGLERQPRIHDLRHTQASWLIAAGESLVVVQRRLGHESITTTIDRYSHLAPDSDESVNAAIDRALSARVPSPERL